MPQPDRADLSDQPGDLHSESICLGFAHMLGHLNIYRCLAEQWGGEGGGWVGGRAGGRAAHLLDAEQNMPNLKDVAV